MRVCVVAEYYPRRRDPVSGAWAHRQAIAARDAGAEVTVLALERPLPGTGAARALLKARPGAVAGELRAAAAQPRHDVLDGIEVEYVRFVSPPRGSSYASWHRWARRPLARALERLHARRSLELVHAHYALPAGGAVLPWTMRRDVPLVVSVHGGDLLSTLLAGHGGDVLRAARVVIANSRGMLERAAALTGSAEHMRVIHPPGEPPPAEPPPKHDQPTVATLGNLDPRKRHVDVLEALALVPEVRWVVIGDGPAREPLRERANELGLADRVEWTGALPPREAVAELARCHVMAMPSVDEAFGVAYTEAIACGLRAIGCAGEPGPEELAGLTDAMALVPARNPEALAEAITRALAAPPPDPTDLFTLAACGARTMDAYREALA